jgi:biofilm protein TabA
MFLGTLADWEERKAILPAALVKAIDAMRTRDLLRIEPGRYEVEGDRIFLLVQEITSRLLAESRVEAHRIYTDIQLVVSGAERMGMAHADPGFRPLDDQLDARDVAFFPTPAHESFVDLYPGMFAVFFPGDLHRPCCAIDRPAPIRKVVAKVHRELLGLR